MMDSHFYTRRRKKLKPHKRNSFTTKLLEVSRILKTENQLDLCFKLFRRRNIY